MELRSSFSRAVTLVLAVGLLGALGLTAPASAAEGGAVFFQEDFSGPSVSSSSPVSVPAVSDGSNAACLTATGTASAPLTTCSDTSDASGRGALRLTPPTTSQTGAVFAASSTPLSRGLDVTFDSYQWGSAADPADGLALVVAAVDPATGAPPATAGNLGGSLGYSAAGSVPGTTGGYLGVGLDVFGGNSNALFQGSGCTGPAFVTTTPGARQPGQVVVRGPGNGTTGYCGLATSGSTSPLPLHGSSRSAARVPVEVALNPAGSVATTGSGLSVPAHGWAVAYTPIGQAKSVLSGTLPVVPAGLYPAGWLDSSGRPKQVTIGFTAGTGGDADTHEVGDVVATALTGSPQLTVSAEAFVHSSPLNADPLTYSVRAGVSAKAQDETYPVTVTATLPDQVVPLAGAGDGWTCTVSGQQLSCAYQYVYLTAGTALPELRLSARVAATGLSSATVAATPIAVSALDAPTTAVRTIAVSDPSPAFTPVLVPSTGPVGTTLTVTGVKAADATIVQIGGYDQVLAGTATVFARCPSGRIDSSCFTTTSAGDLRVPAVPDSGAASTAVAVSTLSVIQATTFTYSNTPGAPAPSATAGGSRATLRWSAPPDGGSAVTGYTVQTYRAGRLQPTTTAVDAGATSVDMTGLTPGASYTFAMSATNANGTSPYGAQSNAVTPFDVPATPAAPVLTYNKYTQTLTATWKPPSSDGGSAVTGYYVSFWTDGLAIYGTTVGPDQTTQDLGLATGRSTYYATVAAINDAGQSANSPGSNQIPIDNPVSVSLSPGGAEVGVAFSVTPAASGGAQPYTYGTTGSLPPGLALDASTGVLSGTPTAAGSYPLTLTVTDAVGQQATTSTTIVVSAALRLTFANPLPAASQDQPYRQVLGRSGGTAPFTYAVTSGSLPAGLSLDPAGGVVSGTPTTRGTASFTVRVTDALGATASRRTSISVQRLVAVTVVPAARTLGLGGSTRFSVATSPVTSGSVTLTLRNPAGTTSTVGSTQLDASGRASFTGPALDRFGRYAFTATVPGDASHDASSGTTAVEVQATAGQLIVRSYRYEGFGGRGDQFVELYNPGAPVPLAGFTVRADSGESTTLPDSAPVLGTGRSYLVAGPSLYTDDLSTPDLVVSSVVSSGGVRLQAPDTARTVTDAVGPTSGAHTGTGLPVVDPGDVATEWAWMRHVVAGRPVDTRNNATDFSVISTNDSHQVGAVTSVFGLPTPRGSADPWQHNQQLSSYLLAPTLGESAAPNRDRDVFSNLVVRRTIVNSGSTTVTRARLRLTALSQVPGVPRPGAQPAKVADLELSSTNGDTSTVAVPGRGQVTVHNLHGTNPYTLRGGWDSTLDVPLPASGLAPGQSVDVAVSLRVKSSGTFWVGWDVDALTSSSAATGGSASPTARRALGTEAPATPFTAHDKRAVRRATTLHSDRGRSRTSTFVSGTVR